MQRQNKKYADGHTPVTERENAAAGSFWGFLKAYAQTQEDLTEKASLEGIYLISNLSIW